MAIWKWLQFIVQRVEGCASQPGIVYCFLNQILRRRTLIVEPHQQIDGLTMLVTKNSIRVLRRVEQLILFGLGRGFDLRRLLVAQGNKSVDRPAFRLIAELALLVGVGTQGAFPLRRRSCSTKREVLRATKMNLQRWFS